MVLTWHGRRKNNTNRDEVTTSSEKSIHRLQWFGRIVFRYRMRESRTGARSHRRPFNRKKVKPATPTRDHQVDVRSAWGWPKLIESRMVPLLFEEAGQMPGESLGLPRLVMPLSRFPGEGRLMHRGGQPV